MDGWLMTDETIPCPPATVKADGSGIHGFSNILIFSETLEQEKEES
jgi:hypothetical protein